MWQYFLLWAADPNTDSHSLKQTHSSLESKTYSLSLKFLHYLSTLHFPAQLCVLDPTNALFVFSHTRFLSFVAQIHTPDVFVSWLLNCTCKEEKVPTQDKCVHCQSNGSSIRRHYHFIYFSSFIEIITYNKILLYEVYLIYFDNYRWLYNHHHNQDRE